MKHAIPSPLPLDGPNCPMETRKAFLRPPHDNLEQDETYLLLHVTMLGGTRDAEYSIKYGVVLVNRHSGMTCRASTPHHEALVGTMMNGETSHIYQTGQRPVNSEWDVGRWVLTVVLSGALCMSRFT